MSVIRKLLSVLLLLTMLVGCASGQSSTVAAIVNGEEVLQSEVDSQLNYYQQLYAASGVDTTDETIAAYVESIALTAAISDHLLVQDMTAKGVFTFTEEEESDIQNQAKEAYATLVSQIAASYKTTEEGSSATDDEALTYAED